jgi:hypothetical protein
MLSLMCWTALAQGSRQDYQRALGLAQKTENTVFRASVQPQWIAGGGGRFWYRVTTSPDQKEFVFVDPERGVREPLFDATVLAQRLTKASGNPVRPESLNLESLTVELEGEHRVLRFKQAGKRWKAQVPKLTLEADPKPETSLNPAPSQRIPKSPSSTGPARMSNCTGWMIRERGDLTAGCAPEPNGDNTPSLATSGSEPIGTEPSSEHSPPKKGTVGPSL